MNRLDTKWRQANPRTAAGKRASAAPVRGFSAAARRWRLAGSSERGPPQPSPPKAEAAGGAHLSILTWTWIFVGSTFALYLGVAIWVARVNGTTKRASTSPGSGVHRGRPTGWRPRRTGCPRRAYISMAGHHQPSWASPAARATSWAGPAATCCSRCCSRPTSASSASFTVPDFVGDRFDSRMARLVGDLLRRSSPRASPTWHRADDAAWAWSFSRFLEVEVDHRR